MSALLTLKKRLSACRRPSQFRLETSLNPMDTFRLLKNTKWSWIHLQYVILFGVLAFCFAVVQFPGFWGKIGFSILLGTALTVPLTRQIFFPAIVIITWAILFYSCRFVPERWRPPIWVRVLPTLENILYGSNLSNILSKSTHSILDVLAWLPYGVVHYSAPIVISFILFIFAPPGTLPVWARTFGYMNLIGVLIQMIFPCSPPWYEDIYGLTPATYAIRGSPGGLARIDALFGTSTYTTGFNNSPIVFGAFPSLHAGWAMLEALFLSHVFPKYRFCFYFYVLWLCWCTMYLNHHYFVDLVGGMCLALTCFVIAQKLRLPQVQTGKILRWEYEFVIHGHGLSEKSNSNMVNTGSPYLLGRESFDQNPSAVAFLNGLNNLELADVDHDWSIDSSSPSRLPSPAATSTGKASNVSSSIFDASHIP
ncbi:inositol phosphorylceramide synthase Aur1 [Schizosaccharomyces cryophilus OY26]|uniref:Inositol phosphorylceramide synthase Aur1 n=1 Tax=Schizosaccharomyces cryophilus (strain OY26 / ATCC MYA-4695 / CBS 11777 / NBRC 106824 / NRRL Y48691) TaxID=653667 RepID=S9XAJ3_SCHCR|nr:inositol phosphorylceramide synthase Aur1 [Schizosaccharomyces cryophilus OY26]EPY54172.1 inositol phosphorylceramide synthase Aur1 [Schizosaccharomyces cryophilus OY26]